MKENGGIWDATMIRMLKNVLFIPFLALTLTLACSISNEEFFSFAQNMSTDAELESICHYLDNVSSKFDSIGYTIAIKGSKALTINTIHVPTTFVKPDFPSPANLFDIMYLRKIRFIFRIKSQNCVFVSFIGKNRDNILRYMVYHSGGYEKCQFFKDKPSIQDSNPSSLGYKKINDRWSIYTEKASW